MPVDPNSRRTIITYGTFDLFHVGHVRLLRRAKSLGDKLIVGLSTDAFNTAKGKKAHFSYEDRKEILESCSFVDLVIPENTWEQKYTDILNHNAKIFVMGSDWIGEFDFLNTICDVVYLDRTNNISTTDIKTRLSQLNS